MCVCAAVDSIAALGSIPRVPPRRSLPAWELKILAAQNILFNQELFSQVACNYDAYDRDIPLLLLLVTAADEGGL